MKIYTFQPLFVWHSLQELGYYHPHFLYENDPFLKDEANSSWGFTHAYNWLKKEMLTRNIQSIANTSHMVWAWYQWNGIHQPKPDKRFASVYAYFEDEEYVMMELDIPDERVLLSDYDAWHFVLNYWPLVPQRESNKIDKQYDFYKKKPAHNKEGNDLICKSWENVFDMKVSRKILQTNQKSQQIQATFFDLTFNDVTKVHFFKDKKCHTILDLTK